MDRKTVLGNRKRVFDDLNQAKAAIQDKAKRIRGELLHISDTRKASLVASCSTDDCVAKIGHWDAHQQAGDDYNAKCAELEATFQDERQANLDIVNKQEEFERDDERRCKKAMSEYFDFLVSHAKEFFKIKAIQQDMSCIKPISWQDDKWEHTKFYDANNHFSVVCKPAYKDLLDCVRTVAKKQCPCGGRLVSKSWHSADKNRCVDFYGCSRYHTHKCFTKVLVEHERILPRFA